MQEVSGVFEPDHLHSGREVLVNHHHIVEAGVPAPPEREAETGTSGRSREAVQAEYDRSRSPLEGRERESLACSVSCSKLCLTTGH